MHYHTLKKQEILKYLGGNEDSATYSDKKTDWCAEAMISFDIPLSISIYKVNTDITLVLTIFDEFDTFIPTKLMTLKATTILNTSFAGRGNAECIMVHWLLERRLWFPA